MTNTQKTAIQQAEKQLEQDRAEKLRNEVYNYLKGELEAIDSIDQRIRKLSEEKRAHEENIKNIKQGNLKAIEDRRNSYTWEVVIPNTWNNNFPINYCNGSAGTSGTFYATAVAGTTVTTSTGKTYFF